MNLNTAPVSYLTEEPPLELIEYSGEFLRAKLPPDWDIQELTNIDGMDDLRTNADYIGLTGINVLKNGETLMQLRGVDGIGGIKVCSELHQFLDTNPSYIENNVLFAREQGLSDPIVVDLSEHDFVEIEILGHDVRKVGDNYYWNNSNSSSEFNPICGDLGSIQELEGLSFSIENTAKPILELYKVTFADNLTDSDFKGD